MGSPVYATALRPGFPAWRDVGRPRGEPGHCADSLSIEGLSIPQSMQGRVLVEAMQKPQKVTMPASKTERLEVSRGTYCAVVEVSSIGARRYLNYGSRCADTPPSAAAK